MLTPGNPGFIASRAASTPRVTSSVLPQGNFSMISISPGPSLITASPIIPCGPNTIFATSPNSNGFPFLRPIATCAKVSGVWPADVWSTSNRWFGVSMKPPVPMCAPPE